MTDRLLRLKEIVSGKDPLVPVGKSTWWAGVSSGRFPPAVKIGPKTTCWRLSDIQKLIETGSWI